MPPPALIADKGTSLPILPYQDAAADVVGDAVQFGLEANTLQAFTRRPKTNQRNAKPIPNQTRAVIHPST